MYTPQFAPLKVFLAILSILFVTASAQASPVHYSVHLPDEGGSGTIYGCNTQTHRILWSLRNASVISPVCWSRDRHCCAIVWWNHSSKKYERRFTIWYIGHRPRTYIGLPEPMERYKDPPLATDYIVDMAWSPDDRNLLMRANWLSGNASQGWGILWHINVRHYQARLLEKRLVAGAEWVSPTCISYDAIITSMPYVEKERTIHLGTLYNRE